MGVGCISPEMDKTRKQGISNQILKLRICSQQHQSKLEQEISRQETVLSKEFLKARHERNRHIEYSIIEQIVQTRNRRHSYSVVENNCRKVEVYKHFIGDPEKQQAIFPPLRELLYIAEFLSDSDLTNLRRTMKRNYPQVHPSKDEEVADEVLRAQHSGADTMKKMTNEYVLELCQHYDLKLEEINEVGHQFKFGA